MTILANQTMMMTSTTGSSKEKGFTILEILVVVALISLLASIMTSTIRMVRRKAVKGEAKNRIARLETALELYKLEQGYYPTGNIAAAVTALTSSAGGKGPFMKFRTGELSGGNFIDPWGMAYNYTNDTTDNYVEIKSKGPNKTDDGGGDDTDDIESKRYY